MTKLHPHADSTAALSISRAGIRFFNAGTLGSRDVGVRVKDVDRPDSSMTEELHHQALTEMSRLGHEDTAGAGLDDGLLSGEVDLCPLIIVASEDTARVVRTGGE